MFVNMQVTCLLICKFMMTHYASLWVNMKVYYASEYVSYVTYYVTCYTRLYASYVTYYASSYASYVFVNMQNGTFETCSCICKLTPFICVMT